MAGKVYPGEGVEENHNDDPNEEAEGCGVAGGGHVERGHAVLVNGLCGGVDGGGLAVDGVAEVMVVYRGWPEGHAHGSLSGRCPRNS